MDLNEELNKQYAGGEENEAILLERPNSWSSLVKILYTVDEKKYLKVSNQDGFFYLLYLKHCA